MTELNAPTGWRCIDFISDLHLSAAAPRTFEAFAAYLQATPADAVLVLGDLFDVWIGDDARHEGFERHCADLLASSAARRSIGFMAGNRDFLIGNEFLSECGLIGLADPTVLVAFGERLLLTHGDSLCLADTAYQDFRAVVRDPRWQQAFLSKPIDERRHEAQRVRELSESRRTDAGGADIDPAAAVGWLREAGASTLIHGHTHRPRSDPLAPGFVRHVLSDWDLDAPAPRRRAEVLRWQGGALDRRRPESPGGPD